MPKYPKKKLAQLVLQECVERGIEHVIISPGSRNAPLTLGFVNHPKINALSIVDERCAAFFALGMAQQLREPVVLLCTSGSALLNYYPAIAEAYYSKIPLIVISADRPKHLIDIGDGQTIRQEGVFKNHILFEANIEDEMGESFDDPESPEFLMNGRLVLEALTCAQEKMGPVHINIPFDEPLYETVASIFPMPKIHHQDKKLLSGSLLMEEPIPVDELQKFADLWNGASKKMVVLGSNFPDELIRIQLSHLAKDPSVLIFTETTSNVANDRFINNIDQLIFPLSQQELEELKPDILLTFGGMVVSKKVKEFLRKYRPKLHWHVDAHRAFDTYHCLSHHFAISAQLFFSQFFFLTKHGSSPYQAQWVDVKNQRKIRHREFLDQVDYSDILVFDKVLKSIPKYSNVQLANSSVIRYSQLFDLDATLKIFCNRGTSGIDGSTSTAIGAACAQQERTVFITGDISFFYDSNALWNKYIPMNFRIVLINNGGGGIFRFIPGPKASDALDFFETTHDLNASSLCKMFGFSYTSANNEQALNKALQTFYEDAEKPKLLEIFTPTERNDEFLKAYFNALT
jgi:2-succinyl-5-enolpyruvyl-6-hydroxy-3-cyclohexene-1-carboxylate synthase